MGEAGVVAIFAAACSTARYPPCSVTAQTRDYVFVSDVVEATWRASTALLPASGLLDARAFIGNGRGHHRAAPGK